MEEASEAIFSIGPLEVTGPVITMIIMVALLGIAAAVAARNLKERPGTLQAVAEMAVGGLVGYFSGLLGPKKARQYFPVFATFFIFIIVSNYLGLLPGAGHITGFSVPTSSLSVTAALAGMTFLITHTLGIREKGLKNYLKSFLKPVILLLPLTLIEQIVRPFSLALRLYGNIFGEESVTTNLYSIFPIGVPIVMMVLSLLFCAIQAMVFTMLFSIYVHEAIADDE